MDEGVLSRRASEPSRTEVPALRGERRAHGSGAQQACRARLCVQRLSARGSPQPACPAWPARQHMALPCSASSEAAPGLGALEEEGTADGWPSGRTGGCPGRRPLPRPQPTRRVLFLSARWGRRALPVPSQTPGLVWAPWSLSGLHLAPGSSMDWAVQVSGEVWASRARRTLRTGPGPNPSLPPAPPPAACHLPPGGRGGS